MSSGKTADRRAKLATALKQNLKRRKSSTAAKDDANSSQDVGLGAGTAPQKGLNPLPGKSPKTASKRN
jgi:hypothetical protein